MKIQPQDLNISVFDLHPSARVPHNPKGVKVLHIPSGIEVVCDEFRFQHRNKAEAIQKLALMIEQLPEQGELFNSTEILPGGQYYSTQNDGRKMLYNADGTRSIFDDVDE